MVGTTRRARLISAATALALLLAVVGFVILRPAEDTIPHDAYTVEAEQICLSAKQQIVATEQAGGSGFAAALVPVVGNWRGQMQELTPPPDRLDKVEALEAALLNAEIRIAKLARLSEGTDSKRTLASAKRADAASAEVEEAVSDLGLSECAEAAIGFSETPG